MEKWQQIGKNTNREGTTITYSLIGQDGLLVQSRKRHIPHANRSGSWDHTTYVLMAYGADLKTFQTLKEAKAYAEDMAREADHGA